LNAIDATEHVQLAQFLVDFVLIIVITVASVFLMPVSMLLQVQTLNFMSGQTTPERLKAAAISKHGTRSTTMKGKEYARFILLNFEENQNIFVNKKAAIDFAKHMENIQDDSKSQQISEDESAEKKDASPNDISYDSPDSFYSKHKENKKKTSRSSSGSKRFMYGNQDEGCYKGMKRSGKNCLRFIKSRQMSQEQMVQDDMEINIKLLLSTPNLNHAL
jgi:hypothetical protein